MSVTVAEPRDERSGGGPSRGGRGGLSSRGGRGGRGGGPPPRGASGGGGAERYSMPTYGSWKSPGSSERVRERSGERYY